jgi:hypothetical protein
MKEFLNRRTPLVYVLSGIDKVFMILPDFLCFLFTKRVRGLHITRFDKQYTLYLIGANLYASILT